MLSTYPALADLCYLPWQDVLLVTGFVLLHPALCSEDPNGSSLVAAEVHDPPL